MEKNTRFLIQLGRLAQVIIDQFLGEYSCDVDWDILITEDIVDLVDEEETEFYKYISLICGEYTIVIKLDNDVYEEIKEIVLWHNNTVIDEWGL